MGVNRFGQTLADVEREHILETLSACDGNRTRTARLLDISIRCLRMKLHRFGEPGSQIAAADRAVPSIGTDAEDVPKQIRSMRRPA
jgi:two-component system, response regulator FlrC